MAGSNRQVSSELVAARTEAIQQAEATNFFKTLLLIAGVVGLIGVVVYVLNYTIVQPPVREAFDNKQAYAKIAELEKQLQVLKSEIAAVKPPNPFVAVSQSVIKFAVTYWALFGFLFGVGIAIYVKLRFKIDYFESYRDLATKKMLSEFYRDLGDRMMASTEWKAAEAAYRDSLVINPTNIQATYGIAKASVFQPLEGQKFYAPEIAEAKLDFLIENSIRRGTSADRAQLYFLKGVNRSLLNDEQAYRYWLNKSIEADARYAPAYLNLGFSYFNTGEIEKGIECYRKAAEIDPNWSLANNNLGSAYMDVGEFPKAVECLDRANKLEPSFGTQIILGEAYRYAGRLADALAFHKNAVTNLETEGIENERYAYGSSRWGFMPLQPGSTETIGQSVWIRSLAEKKMLAYYAVAFDRALSGDYSKADKMFGRARACDVSGEFNTFIINRIDSTLNFLNPEPENRAWFEQKRKLLLAGAA